MGQIEWCSHMHQVSEAGNSSLAQWQLYARHVLTNNFQKKALWHFVKDRVQAPKYNIVNKKWKVSFTRISHPELVLTLWIIQGWKIGSTSQLPNMGSPDWGSHACLITGRVFYVNVKMDNFCSWPKKVSEILPLGSEIKLY